MLSEKIEFLLQEIYQKNQKIQTLCLLKSDGNFSVFLTKKNFDEGGKKRLAASIMASVVLAERAIINLIQEQVKHVIIKAENTNTIIIITKDKNYLYILAENNFDYNPIFTLNFDF